MIIPDLNLLIYAYDRKSPHHEKARIWWEDILSGSVSIGISWVVILGFIRLWTNASIFIEPMTVDAAATHVESWLARRVVRIVSPGPRHGEILFGFLRETGKGGNVTTDAHLAALAVEHRAVIHTGDTDFLRFTGVQCVNPLKKNG